MFQKGVNSNDNKNDNVDVDKNKNKKFGEELIAYFPFI
jgi:hypothetical protein